MATLCVRACVRACVCVCVYVCVRVCVFVCVPHHLAGFQIVLGYSMCCERIVETIVTHMVSEFTASHSRLLLMRQPQAIG